MRILLTGAAGFLGSHLTDRFLEQGHEVIGADNFVTGREANLAHLNGHPRFRLIRHNVIEPLDIQEPLDWVIHFASPASPPKYLQHPIDTLRVNGEGAFRLLELARRHGGRFFMASTSEVYGDPSVHPQSETYFGNVNPTGPRSVYDEGNRYAEAMVAAFHRTYGMSTRIMRGFNTYGPRMDPEDGRVVSNFIRQALAGEPLTVYGDGSQTRSLQYVSDMVEAVTRLMQVEYCFPVNLGNPEEYTVLEIAQLVKELTGSSSPIDFRPLPEEDPKKRRPDISLASRLTGWKPVVPAREGLMITIEYFRTLAGCELSG
ncbi:MAG: UDP-glucuronic acid decarboxylase family protein [Candidatus Eremiobacterota bacterium]